MAGLDNQTKIIALLVIDIVFFFIEIISGYAVGSLALVADSFHMLNDIMSLVVALYAVRLVQKGGQSPKYSYGWQRAEILGALFNGVFLMALCFSIFMEALERLIAKPQVSNPHVVVIVGSLGLLSNIVGLCLFHGHGHVHGHNHSHDHGHDHDIENGTSHHHDMEQGHENHHVHKSDSDQHQNGNCKGRQHLHGHEYAHDRRTESVTERTTLTKNEEAELGQKVRDIVGHPAKARAFVMDKAHSLGYDTASSKHDSEHHRLLSPGTTSSSYGTVKLPSTSASPSRQRRRSHAEASTEEDVRRHRQSIGSGAHTHDNMNMTGVFLHVLGDAIGNVGVIFAGAFILFTEYSWRHYADPVISFIIACIIFHSALPLVKSASFILLQGVPTTVSLDGVRDSVLRIEGVLSVHDLHVWQLNENKIVASLHIMVDCSGEQTTRYMSIADQVRRTLHIWGIHSSTIQPEFVPGGLKEAAELSGVAVQDRFDEHGRLLTPDGHLVREEVASGLNSACLLACDGDECRDAQCCEMPTSGKSSATP